MDYHSSPPVTPYYDRDNGIIYVSMTDGRAKTANLRRDPRAALECTSSDGRAWATAEGHVTLTGPGTDPDGPEVQALVDYYRGAAGEHPDWDEYRSGWCRTAGYSWRCASNGFTARNWAEGQTRPVTS
ncbi:pyridoxine/pyridoxamine 5'-phosphate oxidase [Mycobacteroides abscessus]|nr:pyridoxine/pyridoxamine 5'-phosphate oxidase [Mycobacteroides abscessus]